MFHVEHLTLRFAKKRGRKKEFYCTNLGAVRAFRRVGHGLNGLDTDSTDCLIRLYHFISKICAYSTQKHLIFVLFYPALFFTTPRKNLAFWTILV